LPPSSPCWLRQPWGQALQAPDSGCDGAYDACQPPRAPFPENWPGYRRARIRALAFGIWPGFRAARPGPGARAGIVAELRAGLLDAADAYCGVGLPADRAAAAAVSEFGAGPPAQPLRIGPGVIRAGFRTTGQGLGEHERGGGLEFPAEQAGGAGRLEAQGPPGLAVRVDLGEFRRAATFGFANRRSMA